MTTIYFILVLLALVCFALAALAQRTTVETRSRLDLVALGLAFWVLVYVISYGRALN